MNITLREGNKEKTYSVSAISGKMLRRTIEINKTMDLSDMDVDTLDAVADYIVDAFEKQFDREAVYTGLSCHELLPTFQALMMNVMSKANDAIGGNEDPNVRLGA